VFAGSEWRLAAGILYSTLLVVACLTDVRWRRIPNVLVLALALTGFAFSVALEPWWPGLLRAVGGLALGFAIWIPFHVAGGMGAGDVKLFAAAAAWLGPSGAWRAALVAALAGGVLSLGALMWQRRTREGVERVAMSLSMMSLVPLGKVATGQPRKAYLPYGVALACGALLAAWVPRILVN
jgi:prepilin peptidase CpaA